MTLEKYLETCPPFEWGTFNCCHFVSGWVKTRTGVDYMARMNLPFTGGYVAAARLRTQLGGLRSAVSSCIGEPQELPDTVVGDIVLFYYEGVELLGIYTGQGVICVELYRAFSLFPLTVASCSWRVPS